jgi:hypothetical protein
MHHDNSAQKGEAGRLNTAENRRREALVTSSWRGRRAHGGVLSIGGQKAE